MAVEVILVVVAIVAAVVWMEYFPVKTDSGLDFSKRLRSPLAVHLVIDVHAESFDATIPSPAEPHPDTAETAVVKGEAEVALMNMSANTVTYCAPKAMNWYSQYNNPYVVIGCGNMQSNGCVPTSAAMLLSAYGLSVSPTDMGYYLYSTGNYNSRYGHGGSDLCWYDIANYAGLAAEGVYSFDSFETALRTGAVVACHIYYGGGTHAVLATGYDNGQTCIYDPIGGVYWRSTASVWGARSFVWNDVLSGTSIIAVR